MHIIKSANARTYVIMFILINSLGVVANVCARHIAKQPARVVGCWKLIFTNILKHADTYLQTHRAFLMKMYVTSNVQGGVDYKATS